ncbi:DUF4384 domain-containing protein [Candidatus Halobeggiatoa sp. HSG11]|nr:DUF4384 domain-containing protein [Candidatus Halobeggiatoa sp. HSG11]
MKEIILTIVLGLLLTIAGLFIEKCYFEENSCPIESMNTSTPEPSTKVTKKTTHGFKINYLYRSAGQGKPLSFAKKSTLKTGDTYKIIFQPPAKKHVYIFQIDSTNKIFQLFPTTDFENADKKNKNPVKKGKKYFVPAKKWSFELDPTTGKETIYTIVTNKPDKQLEQQYATMLAQQETQTPKQRKVTRNKWHKAMKKRGFKRKLIPDNSASIKWQEQGQKLSTTLFNVQKMCDGCVNVVGFEHR